MIKLFKILPLFVPNRENFLHPFLYLTFPDCILLNPKLYLTKSPFVLYSLPICTYILPEMYLTAFVNQHRERVFGFLKYKIILKINIKNKIKHCNCFLP